MALDALRSFNRFELKYIVTKRDVDRMRPEIAAYMVRDPYAGDRGTYTLSSMLTISAAIPIAGGLWLDNPNLTVLARGGNFTQSGLLRVSAGTFNVGTAADNSLQLQSGSTTIVDGGAINVAGRFGVSAAASAITYTQSGGTVTANTLGNTSTTLASFDLGTAGATAATISGGSIVLQIAASAVSGPRDFRNQAGVLNVTGGRLQLGNASTPAAQTYFLRGTAPGLDITNTPAGHTVRLGAATTAVGPTDIRAGASLLTQVGTNLVDGPIDRERHVSLRSVSGQVGREAVERVTETRHLGGPRGSAQDRPVEEDDRRAAVGPSVGRHAGRHPSEPACARRHTTPPASGSAGRACRGCC